MLNDAYEHVEIFCASVGEHEVSIGKIQRATKLYNIRSLFGIVAESFGQFLCGHFDLKFFHERSTSRRTFGFG